MARYIFTANVEGDPLFHETKSGERSKKVAIYENIFDIIHQAHIHLSHAKDVRTHD
jgi:hypothetical protein